MMDHMIATIPARFESDDEFLKRVRYVVGPHANWRGLELDRYAEEYGLKRRVV
jgi:hypothetical protein